MPEKSVLPSPSGRGAGGEEGNLIIHGDNLHALKALMPHSAGKVDGIFIDPPYNTGNENWCDNDKVNSPIMQEWLSNNPVNKEDFIDSLFSDIDSLRFFGGIHFVVPGGYHRLLAKRFPFAISAAPSER